MNNLIIQSLQESQQVLADFLGNPAKIEAIEKAADVLVDALKKGNKILSCGNGGSHCDAMHFAEELSGRYRENRPALAAMAISDPSHISCVSNDFGYNYIFSRFIEGLGNKGDVLVGISTSGSSGMMSPLFQIVPGFSNITRCFKFNFKFNRLSHHLWNDLLHLF